MAWKNGGGETVEIAVHPAAADLDHVDWRVSLATMTTDGPFSSFPGLDRTLAVVEGEGLVLCIGQQHPVRLDIASEPFRFPADQACTASLVSGPVTDLNVMTRRSRFHHTVRRVPVPTALTVRAEAGTLLVCCAGTVSAGSSVLERYDVLVSGERASVDLVPGGPNAVIALITMWPG